MSNYFDLLKAAKLGGNLPSYYETLLARKLPCSKYAWTETTLTGIPPITFRAKGTPLTDYSIIGNMVHTGTPTKDVPITPEECGDKTANLFDDAFEIGSIGATGTNINQDTMVRQKNYCAVEPSTVYRVYANNYTPTGIWVNYYTESGTFISRENVTGTAFTTPETCGRVRFRMTRDYTINTDVILMFNAGSTALPFEPYGYKITITVGGTTQTVYLSEPLRKIGDYSDGVTSDETVTRKIKKLVLDGTEDWRKSSAYSDGFFLKNVVTDYVSQYTPAYCSHFVQSTTQQDYTSGKFLLTGDLNIRCGDDQWTLTDWKTWLSNQYANGTRVTVWYVMNTTQTDSATCPTITPASGSNTLSVGTTLAPSSVSITGMIKEES